MSSLSLFCKGLQISNKRKKMKKFEHTPVLLNEVISGLNIKPAGVFVDCTIGGGGHSFEILKKAKKGFLYGFDRDDHAIKASSERLGKYKNFEIIKSNFNNAKEELLDRGVEEVDGILIDLGVSSFQIDEKERGFSFLHEGKLDMRMDTNQKRTAFDVVNFSTKEELLKILWEYGEESNARKIVDNILNQRKIKPIETTFQLKEIIEKSFPKKVVFGKGGVSKKTFQAIRIEVNDELSGLKNTLYELVSLLKKGGRIAVISFHSLEDRIVKTVFKDLALDCVCPPRTPICICNHRAKGVLINRKPITASEEELQRNSRSSSAKLRVFEKI